MTFGRMGRTLERKIKEERANTHSRPASTHDRRHLKELMHTWCGVLWSGVGGIGGGGGWAQKQSKRRGGWADIYISRERERSREREGGGTDGQTDEQRERERERERQTDRQTSRERERERQTDTGRQTGRQTSRERERGERRREMENAPNRNL